LNEVSDDKRQIGGGWMLVLNYYNQGSDPNIKLAPGEKANPLPP